MSLDKMRPLPNQFRKMPKLAMKAKLYGKFLLNHDSERLLNLMINPQA